MMNSIRKVCAGLVTGLVALLGSALLGACGGGAEEAVSQDIAAQHQKQAAALVKAHATNADTVSKIRAERAGQKAATSQ